MKNKELRYKTNDQNNTGLRYILVGFLLYDSYVELDRRFLESSQVRTRSRCSIQTHTDPRLPLFATSTRKGLDEAAQGQEISRKQSIEALKHCVFHSIGLWM
jgi:hypothetical protein